MTLGERVRYLREAFDWSQGKLAEKAGITSMAISHIECDRRSPRLATLEKVRAAFDVSWGHLLDGVTIAETEEESPDA